MQKVTKKVNKFVAVKTFKCMVKNSNVRLSLGIFKIGFCKLKKIKNFKHIKRILLVKSF